MTFDEMKKRVLKEEMKRGKPLFATVTTTITTKEGTFRKTSKQLITRTGFGKEIVFKKPESE